MVPVITLMGVSGCGKTTVGIALSEYLGWKFIESDDYHSDDDIRKMSAGIPLTDQDRWPWLVKINHALLDAISKGEKVVLACSALKRSYREMLYASIKNGVYVYLKGSYSLIQKRMLAREHFMKAGLLQSQFDALEEPKDAVVIDIRSSVSTIVEQIAKSLQLD